MCWGEALAAPAQRRPTVTTTTLFVRRHQPQQVAVALCCRLVSLSLSLSLSLPPLRCNVQVMLFTAAVVCLAALNALYVPLYLEAVVSAAVQ